MKGRHSKCSFVLGTCSDVRNKPLTIKMFSHKPAQTYYNKSRTFLLCEKQWCNTVTNGGQRGKSHPLAS